MRPIVSILPDHLRIDYAVGHLSESEVAANPFDQFEQWFAEAQVGGAQEPNAMVLATSDVSGKPSARVVLLKSFDSRGFSFFTNYTSRKGNELQANPRAALCFYWQPLERQVRIEGTVEQVSREESEAYFRTRPVGAQVGAWASNQSQLLVTRETLERREAELSARFSGGPVPLPDFWGGYRVVPNRIEFWQGRPSRLHDRIVYERDAGGAWTIHRLSP